MSTINKDWKINAPDNQNIKLVLNYPPDYYRKRLEKIGFSNKKAKLLDAACGAGHWSIAASTLFRKVESLDLTEKYLNVARLLKKNFKRNNLSLTLGKMENLPFKNDQFDYVICYCAWMYTRRSESLKELARVLKPGGYLYLGAVADLGWYLKMIWQGIKEGNRALIFDSLRAIKNQVPTNEKETINLLAENKLEIIGLGSDASLGDSKIKVEPFYKGKFLGFRNVYEVLAKKRVDK